MLAPYPLTMNRQAWPFTMLQRRCLCCAGDDLGCATEAAVRQEHVRDAIRWSWKGYRRVG